jgi:hypothetical protein
MDPVHFTGKRREGKLRKLNFGLPTGTSGAG